MSKTTMCGDVLTGDFQKTLEKLGSVSLNDTLVRCRSP